MKSDASLFIFITGDAGAGAAARGRRWAGLRPWASPPDNPNGAPGLLVGVLLTRPNTQEAPGAAPPSDGGS